MQQQYFTLKVKINTLKIILELTTDSYIYLITCPNNCLANYIFSTTNRFQPYLVFFLFVNCINQQLILQEFFVGLRVLFCWCFFFFSFKFGLHTVFLISQCHLWIKCSKKKTWVLSKLSYDINVMFKYNDPAN